MMIFFLAARNLFLMRKRYALMACGIAAGFMMITILTSLSTGILRTLNEKSARFLAGEVSVVFDYNRNRKGAEEFFPNRFFDNASEICADLRNANLPFSQIAPRQISYNDKFPIYFGGRSARARRILGIDFESELDSFSKLPIVAGDVRAMLSEEHGIILSAATAEFLGAQIGDEITIRGELFTDGTVYNTQTYILTAIFNEPNFFAYSCYVSRKDLNALTGLPEDSASEIALYTDDHSNFAAHAAVLRNFLEKRYPERKISPVILDDEQYNSSWREWNTVIYTLNSVLSEIQDMIRAFLFGTYFVLFLFLLLVVIGILNTYKVMVFERTREIGTMRAIGMQKFGILRLFLSEAFLLSAFSSAAGFAAALVTLSAIKNFSLKAFTIVNMFTQNGHLQPAIVFPQMALNFALISAAVFVAAASPAQKACKISPASALRS